MSNAEFIIQRDNIIRQYFDESVIQSNEVMYGQYTIVSANLSNYLPAIDPKMHMKLFAQLLIHKRLSKLEQGSLAALHSLHTENLDDADLKLLKERPAIICTFHTGSYRIINSFLVKNNVPFSLVIGNSIIAAEGEDYHSLYKTLAGQNEKTGFTIIDAENPGSGLQMLRELKRGRNLLLYMDGNSGAGVSTIKNDNNCLVNFLHQQLYARKGIGFLAHAANVPIIPAVNYRPGLNDVRLRFYDAILPDSCEGRDNFATKVTQQLYDILSSFVRQYPEQWEAWMYLHKVASITNLLIPLKGKTSGTMVRFNLKDYGVFQLDKKPFLFQKNSYTSYPIETALYKKLRQSIKKPVSKEGIEKNTFLELKEKGVLHYL